MEYSLKDSILEILGKLKHFMTLPFYNRSNTAITRYTEILHEINDTCNFILNKISGGNIWYLLTRYSNEWAVNDFYKNSSRVLGSLFYNYLPSIEYHRYRKVCENAIDACCSKIKALPTLNSLNSEMYSKLSSYHSSLADLHSDSSTIRHY